jgi:hypothetical protein
MKLLSVHLARSIWLCPVSDLNPKGMNVYPVLFPFLMDTYKFTKYPSATEPPDLIKGIKFENGEFETGEEYPIVINFTIYSDGVIAESISSTRCSDMFLADVFHRFSEIFKMPAYQSMIRKRLYLSQLYFHTDKSLPFLNPKLNEISEYLSQNVEQGDIPFQVGAIAFWPDQISKMNPAPFTFERAGNVPFFENRYYSAAPLPTDKHLELLDKLESILS